MTEKELFDYIKQHIPDLEVSQKTTDRYDCSSKEAKLYIELKCRSKHYDTLLLEYKKYDHLVTKATELGYEPWYINKTPNGIYAFKLHSDSSKYEWTEDMLPATSTFGNGNKILKKVTYLDVSNAGDLI